MEVVRKDREDVKNQAYGREKEKALQGETKLINH